MLKRIFRRRTPNALALAGVLVVLSAAGAAAPASAQTFLHFTCVSGAQFEATLFSDTRAIFLQLDGRSLRLPKRIAASGSRYAKGGVTLRIKGRNATLKRAGKTVACAAD
jgi:membrane-bound inhibitor of C-type lysozyme